MAGKFRSGLWHGKRRLWRVNEGSLGFTVQYDVERTRSAKRLRQVSLFHLLRLVSSHSFREADRLGLYLTDVTEILFCTYVLCAHKTQVSKCK